MRAVTPRGLQLGCESAGLGLLMVLPELHRLLEKPRAGKRMKAIDLCWFAVIDAPFRSIRKPFLVNAALWLWHKAYLWSLKGCWCSLAVV